MLFPDADNLATPPSSIRTTAPRYRMRVHSNLSHRWTAAEMALRRPAPTWFATIYKKAVRPKPSRRSAERALKHAEAPAAPPANDRHTYSSRPAAFPASSTSPDCSTSAWAARPVRSESKPNSRPRPRLSPSATAFNFAMRDNRAQIQTAKSIGRVLRNAPERETLGTHEIP